VDTLPPVHTAELIPAGRVAYQVVALERQVRLQQMQAEAVELMTWSPGREWPADVAWRLISRIHPHRRLPPMATGGGRGPTVCPAGCGPAWGNSPGPIGRVRHGPGAGHRSTWNTGAACRCGWCAC